MRRPPPFVIGFFLFAAILPAAMVSWRLVNQAIPERAKKANVKRALEIEAESKNTPDATVTKTGTTGAEGFGNENKRCMTLDGKIFVWDSPNVPFAAATCSRF